MKYLLRPLLLFGIILALCLPSDAAQPNVLFIICDDLNTHVSSSGYEQILTPNFDTLASSGMTFRRAYCQYPVCGPSRASFLHSLYPQTTGITDNFTRIEETRPGSVSMPQRFKESGYWTGSTGKVFHNKHDPGEIAWHEMIMFENDEMPIEKKAREAWEKEHGPITDPKNRKAWKEYYPTIANQTKGQKPGHGPSGLQDEQHKDGKNVRQIISWIENKAYGDKPFFLACGIHKPHGPFLAPDAYFDLNPIDKIQFDSPPKDFWEQAPKLAKTKRYEGYDFEFGVEIPEKRREYTQAYHACISFIDAQIGLMLQALQRNGLSDNTIVVLIGDNGYQLGDHFMWGKAMLFEGSANIPMLMRVPGLTTPGAVTEELVELVDVFPTLAELCQVEAPEDVQGRSMVPMLENPKAKGKEQVYTVVRRGDNLGKAIRTPRFRYTLWPDGEELYDLSNDPGELNNLAKSPEQAPTLKDMRKRLEKVEQLAMSTSDGEKKIP